MRGAREPLDVDRLSHEGAEVSFDLDLSELPQLRAVHPEVTGRAVGQVRFGREQQLAVADLTLRGNAQLTCQRCMGALEQSVDGVTRLALVGSEEEGTRVPPEFEPVLAAGGRVTLEQLVSEELLLSLPSVPLHAGDAPGCTGKASKVEERETHRPFACLGELVKR
jgi:uncharacterized protein